MAVGPALSISRPGPGWGMGSACPPACLLVLQAEGPGALVVSKDKGFFRRWTYYSLTTSHYNSARPTDSFGCLGSCLCLVQTVQEHRKASPKVKELQNHFKQIPTEFKQIPTEFTKCLISI